jgi:hypothetical protein
MPHSCFNVLFRLVPECFEEKSRETSVVVAGTPAEIEPNTSGIRVYSIPSKPTCSFFVSYSVLSFMCEFEGTVDECINLPSVGAVSHCL